MTTLEKVRKVIYLRLETLCQHLGIPIKAHNALEDIRATKVLLHKINDILFKGK